ncbi:MAG: GNAT family N-acetyltransferase [Sphingobacteriales bacterium]|nr:MAG: GNAT family N-acetyltransferase [Sphingobacteriales bacterium]
MKIPHCSELRTKIYTRAQELPDTWSAALPTGHPLQKQLLLQQEAIVFENVRPMYVAVYAGNQLLVLTFFQLLHLREHHVAAAKMKRWQQRLWRVFSRIRKPRLLVSGHLFRHDFGAVFIPEPVPAFEGFKGYRQALKLAARKTSADAILIKDPPTDFHPLLQHFMPQYRLLPGDISMELTLPESWQTMSDYEGLLKHKYAQRLRNIRKAGSPLDVRSLDAAQVEQEAAAIHQLYEQVAQNQPVRLGFLSPDYLPHLKTSFPESFQVWGFYEDDTLVAFASAWQRGTVLDMFYIGFAYERNRDRQLYFNILFFAVEQAILLRCEKIIFGRTALEAKARLGARPQYLHTFLHIRNPVARALVDQLQTALAETEGDWESRHPFK